MGESKASGYTTWVGSLFNRVQLTPPSPVLHASASNSARLVRTSVLICENCHFIPAVNLLVC